MKKNKTRPSEPNKTMLISAEKKKSIIVIEERAEISDMELAQEIDRLTESLSRIRSQHYSKNSAIVRIQSRSFKDISRAKANQLFSKARNIRKSNA